MVVVDDGDRGAGAAAGQVGLGRADVGQGRGEPLVLLVSGVVRAMGTSYVREARYRCCPPMSTALKSAGVKVTLLVTPV